MKRIFASKQAALLIVTLQEAFTATVPFFLLTSILSSLQFIFAYFNIHFFSLSGYHLHQLQQSFHHFSSFVATATIAYFFARRINTSPIIATVLSIATLITCLGLGGPFPLILIPYGFAPVTLINPIVAVYLFKLFEPKLSLSLPVTGGKKHIYRHINYIFVFLAAYTATVALFELTGIFFSNYMLGSLAILPQLLPQTVFFFFRDLLVQLFWFLGIHGDRVVNTLIGKDILEAQIFPNLTLIEFNRLFVVIGGAGVGLSLLLALLLKLRDRSLRFIAYISAPFVIFNINTLLIYTVVVLNRCFFIPFIILPLFNFVVAYIFLKLINISFSDYYIVWNTPVFLDGYLKTGGDWRIPVFQAFLVAVDTLVYVYFVQRYMRVQSTETQLQRLEHNLRLTEELRSKEGINAFVAHTKVIEAHAKLEALLQDITDENLFVYYQPIVPTKTGAAMGLEALLRYKKGGQIRGPEFLQLVEDAGLAPLVDIWVCRRVKKDLEQMRVKKDVPRMSINLHPDTFLSDEAVSLIIKTLRGEDVSFEIVERSFLAGEASLNNLRRLQEGGFNITIDDFGAGYSSLETIIKHRFFELKLDRSLVETMDTERGRLVCESIVNICHQIGTQVVAEGVETKEQLLQVCAIGADGAQGYYLAPALPLEQALDYLSEHGGPICKEGKITTI